MYADYNHPRLGGLGGKEMNWLRTTTGRHCMTGGFGEQCDLWEEKQVSELGRYGPGEIFCPLYASEACSRQELPTISNLSSGAFGLLSFSWF